MSEKPHGHGGHHEEGLFGKIDGFFDGLKEIGKGIKDILKSPFSAVGGIARITRGAVLGVLLGLGNIIGVAEADHAAHDHHETAAHVAPAHGSEAHGDPHGGGEAHGEAAHGEAHHA